MKHRCSNIRTIKNPKVLPGKWRTARCRNEATRAMRIHQASDHPRVADGWFEVELCHQCFLLRSESHAIINLEGRQNWRWL